MNANKTPGLTILAAAVASLMLVACNKPADDRTAGQKLDETVAKIEQKTDAAVAKIEEKTDEAKAKSEIEAAKLGDKISATADKAEVKMADATITASIKAELARDPSLSALRINVDTKEGLVELHGSAPDATSRDRATRLAASVKGVLSVDNRLVING
jgi:hyperosmotically inducible protein